MSINGSVSLASVVTAYSKQLRKDTGGETTKHNRFREMAELVDAGDINRLRGRSLLPIKVQLVQVRVLFSRPIFSYSS